MATITNSVQGFNETVGLLKQILNKIGGGKTKGAGGVKEKEEDKTQQTSMKDIMLSSMLMSKIDKKGSENIKSVILAFEPLNKLDKKTGDKARGLSEIIKTLTSDDVIKGMQKMKKIPTTAINGVFKMLESIVKSMEKIAKDTDMSVITKFAKMLKAITEAIKNIVVTLFLIAGLVVVAALVGVLAIFAWKQILVGFLTIAAVLGLVVLLTHLVALAAAISLEAILSVFAVVAIMYLIAGLVIVAVLVGLIAIFAWQLILVGFITITAVLGLIVSLTYLVSLAAELSMPTIISVLFVVGIMYLIGGLVFVAALVGLLATLAWPQILIGFGIIVAILVGIQYLTLFIRRTAAMNKGKRNIPLDILMVVGLLFAIGVLVMFAALVGATAMKYWLETLVGFAAIGAILFAIMGVMNIIKTVKAGVKTTISTALMLSLLLVALGGVIIEIAYVANYIKEHDLGWGELLMTVVSMAGILLGVLALLKVVGTIKVDNQGLKAMAIATGVLIASIFALNLLVDVANKVRESGGWGDVFLALVSMIAVIASITLLMGAIGVMALNPFVQAALIAGGIVIGAVSVLVILLSTAISSIVDAYDKVKTVGIDNLSNIGKKMAQALVDFVEKVHAGLSKLKVWDMIKIGMMMRPIEKIVNTCSTFINMISGFSTEGCSSDELRPVKYNEAKGTYVLGKKVNVIKAATAITTAFTYFVKTVTEELKNLENKQLRKIKRMMKPVSMVIDTCTKFLDMIKGFSSEGCAASELRTVIYDEQKGEFKLGPKIDLVASATTITGAFSTFIITLCDKFKEIDGKERRRFEKVSKMGLLPVIDSCSSFIKMISGIADANGTILNFYETDENGNFVKDKKGNYKKRPVDMNVSANVIADGFGTFISNFAKYVANLTNKEKRRLKMLNEMNIEPLMNMVTSFIEMISTLTNSNTNPNVLSIILKKSNGEYIMKNGKYVTMDVDMKKSAGIVGDAIGQFLKVLSKQENLTNATTAAAIIDKANEGFSKLTKNIIGIDKQKEKRIRDNTDALCKFADAMHKVAKSIDVLNSKSINDNFDEFWKTIDKYDKHSLKIKFTNDGKLDIIETQSSQAEIEKAKRGNTDGGGGNIDTAAISKAIKAGFNSITNFKMQFGNNVTLNSGKIIIES